MGGDGGSIPKRPDLVREKKKPEQKDRDMERNAKWSHCAISQRELRKPIVSCELGKLYNKDSVIEYLLDKSICDTVTHIRNLKDVKELSLTQKSDYDIKGKELADRYFDTQDAEYICPVAGIEMNGKYKFCFIWNCGCVLSERALREVPSEVCHKCGKSFVEEDLVVLNGNDEDMNKMSERMEKRRLKAKMEKKMKKSGKEKHGKSQSVDNFKTPNSVDESVSKVKDGKIYKHPASIKQNLEQDIPSKRSKVGDQSAKITSQSGSALKYKTVAEDPSASKVYKSLFTSSETHKNRSKDKTSNWVTYNPYHL